MNLFVFGVEKLKYTLFPKNTNIPFSFNVFISFVVLDTPSPFFIIREKYHLQQLNSVKDKASNCLS